MYEIERIAVPARFEPGPWADAVRLAMDIDALDLGTRDLEHTPAEIFAWWSREWQPRELWGVRTEGRWIGTVEYGWDAPAPETAWVAISVHPDHRRRGLGSALLGHAVTRSRADGRTAMQGFTIEPPQDVAEVVYSPTGFGSLDRSTPGVAFALHHGFALGQVERVSRLALPVTGLDTDFGHALAAATDYELHGWIGATPAGWRSTVARLANAIEQDAPQGELAAGVGDWTAEKVAADDVAQATAGITRLVVLVVHRESGEGVGYTELTLPAEPHRGAKQGDTVVLADHRGHKLGMLLKLANIRQLQQYDAGRPCITTYNAEENRYMLATNEAVGFVPIAYEGGWRRAL
jgi:GNAT superfamily N-acetyltransferase